MAFKNTGVHLATVFQLSIAIAKPTRSRLIEAGGYGCVEEVRVVEKQIRDVAAEDLSVLLQQQLHQRPQNPRPFPRLGPVIGDSFRSVHRGFARTMMIPTCRQFPATAKKSVFIVVPTLVFLAGVVGSSIVRL